MESWVTGEFAKIAYVTLAGGKVTKTRRPLKERLDWKGSGSALSVLMIRGNSGRYGSGEMLSWHKATCDVRRALLHKQ